MIAPSSVEDGRESQQVKPDPRPKPDPLQWGFELIKHDYTTFDIFGRWGFQMGAALTRDGWTFASGPGRTTAEVIDELYLTIRAAAGDSLVIGCNSKTPICSIFTSLVL